MQLKPFAIMTKRFGISFFLWLLCWVPISVYAENLLFSGYAYDIEGKQLLYTEQHRIELDPQGKYLTSQVSYLSPSGEVFASKHLDFRSQTFQPRMVFLDQRTQVELNVSASQSSLLLSYQGLNDDSSSAIDMDPDKLSVVDAGFDRLVSQHWQTLLAGDPIYFDFLAITRSSFVGFKVFVISQDKETVDMLIEAESWLVRLLMEPIRLRYDLATRRLVEFSGVTNVQELVDGELSGENYRARINYVYHLPSDESFAQSGARVQLPISAGASVALDATGTVANPVVMGSQNAIDTNDAAEDIETP